MCPYLYVSASIYFLFWTCQIHSYSSLVLWLYATFYTFLTRQIHNMPAQYTAYFFDLSDSQQRIWRASFFIFLTRQIYSSGSEEAQFIYIYRSILLHLCLFFCLVRFTAVDLKRHCKHLFLFFWLVRFTAADLKRHTTPLCLFLYYQKKLYDCTLKGTNVQMTRSTKKLQTY